MHSVSLRIIWTILLVCSHFGSLVFSFVLPSNDAVASLKTTRSMPNHPRRHCLLFYTNKENSSNNNEGDEKHQNEENDNPEDYNDGDDDDEIVQTAYGNRSLAWTNRYRKLIPYEMARIQAMSLGARNKEEWDEMIQGSKCYRGPYVISRPQEMYQEEWISWDEFLGVMRPYHDTQQLVTSVLRLSNLEEYKQFVKSDTKRAGGLRIPAKPEIYYKHKGWTTLEAFFGQTTTTTEGGIGEEGSEE